LGRPQEVSRKRGKQKGDGGREEGIPGKKREGRERGGESEWEARGGHRIGVKDIPVVCAPPLI